MLALAPSQGMKDGQQAMGLMAMAPVTTGIDATGLQVPWWAIVLSMVATSLGAAPGGWRLIERLGDNYVKLWPVDVVDPELQAGSLGSPGWWGAASLLPGS